MITIIFAPPRYGKTALMTHMANMALYERERTKSSWREIDAKNLNGFNLSYPLHMVFANYPIAGKKFGYHSRPSYFVNPFNLGFANNKGVQTAFLPPYSLICITEGQKYFNSCMSLYFPDWQSRFFEQHGHNFLDILIDIQRPMLIDINIRELANYIEALNLDIKTDKTEK